MDASLLRRCSLELQELCDSLERHQRTESKASWAYALVLALTLPYYVHRHAFLKLKRTRLEVQKRRSSHNLFIIYLLFASSLVPQHDVTWRVSARLGLRGLPQLVRGRGLRDLSEPGRQGRDAHPKGAAERLLGHLLTASGRRGEGKEMEDKGGEVENKEQNRRHL